MTTSTGGICVVGSFMMDLIAYAPRRPEPGETLAGTDFVQTPGGKGFNQAVAAARCEVPTSMIGRVGQDLFGDQFVHALTIEGIAHDGVIRDESTGTGVGLPVVTEDGQNSIIIIPRANLRSTPASIAAQREVIESAKVLLLQLELPVEAVVEAAEIAHAAGVRVVLNPAPYTPLPDHLLELCDVVVPNEVELASWAGVDAEDRDEVCAAADRLSRTHDIDVVVTLGSRGVLVVEQGRRATLIDRHVVEAVDTVGAGDTFCGQLCALLASGENLQAAAVRANAAAALAVTRRGGASSAPTRDEVDAFLVDSSTTPTAPDGKDQP